MSVHLTDLIAENYDALVDEITKDAIRQIPSYGEAPLRLTADRVEQAVRAMTKSIRENDPEILQRHVAAVAAQRWREGYAAAELHAIVQLMRKHLADLIARTYDDEIERNGYLMLLEVIFDAAKMMINVAYLSHRSSEQAT